MIKNDYFFPNHPLYYKHLSIVQQKQYFNEGNKIIEEAVNKIQNYEK